MRGQLSKDNITKAILQIFSGSFVEPSGKIIRIPTTCEDQPIEAEIAEVKDLIKELGL